MLFYGDKQHPLDVQDTRDRVAHTVAMTADAYRRRLDHPFSAALETHADLVGAAIALGELHQASSDQRNPAVDDVHPEMDDLASSGALLGRCIYRSALLLRQDGSARDRSPSPAGRSPCADLSDLLLRASAAVSKAVSALEPGRLLARVPEGYAFYSLYPEMYVDSVARALRDHRRRQPFTVIGIRSIGTSLSALVAGALGEMGVEARVETLRPRGHPFDRYIDVAPSLRKRLAEDARNGAGFIIADEGPGLTCSSFLSVCSALSALGVPEEQLTILSAWRGAPSIYASDEGRARWERLRVFHTPPSDAFDNWRALVPFIERALGGHSTNGHRRAPLPRIHDLSYGRWREHCCPSPADWPTVHRAMERTKLLYQFGAGDGALILAKFAGLGEYGQQKHERAAVLAAAGFSPPVVGLAYGFLLHPFLEDGRPMSPRDLSSALLARMVDYYSFVARRFPAPPAPRFTQLAEMVLINTRESLGLDASDFLARWDLWRETIDRLPLALVDGRPQPHEWLRTSADGERAYLKSDSSDHFADHTVVGEQSILWDLAGACEEWQMDAHGLRDLLGLWERRTGDRLATTLIDFYRVAYLAFRVAALHYAVHSTDEDEIRRSLHHEEWRYRQRLAGLVRAEG